MLDAVKRRIGFKKKSFEPIRQIPENVKQDLAVSSSPDAKQRSSSTLWWLRFPPNHIMRYLPQVVVPVNFKNENKSAYHFSVGQGKMARFEQKATYLNEHYDRPDRFNVEQQYPGCIIYAVPQTSQVDMTRCMGPGMKSQSSCYQLRFVSDAGGQCVNNAYYDPNKKELSYNKREKMMIYPNEITVDDSLVETTTWLFEDFYNVFGPTQSKYWAMVFLKVLIGLPNVPPEYVDHYTGIIEDGSSMFGQDDYRMNMVRSMERQIFQGVLANCKIIAKSIYGINEDLIYDRLGQTLSDDIAMPSDIVMSQQQNKLMFYQGGDSQNNYVEENDEWSDVDVDSVPYNDIPFYNNVPDVLGYVTPIVLNQNIASILGVDPDIAEEDLRKQQQLVVNIYMTTLDDTNYTVMSLHDSITVIPNIKPYTDELCAIVFRPKPGYEPWFAAGADPSELQ